MLLLSWSYCRVPYLRSAGIAVSRFTCTTPSVLRYFSIAPFCFSAGVSLSRSWSAAGKKREENWPHPAIPVAGSKDAEIVRRAGEDGATVLGYNVHKEPWLWPDIVRMKHGVIVGGTGAGSQHSSKTSSLRMFAGASGHAGCR